MKIYDVSESVWLTTAIMAYEAYNKSDSPSPEAMYFKQTDIQVKAQGFCDKDVQNARISQWYNADHDNNTYNYLRAGEGATRRLSYKNEHYGVKEAPDLNGDDVIETGLGPKTIKELKAFVAEEYTSLLTDEFRNLT